MESRRYGTWVSPITAKLVAKGACRLGSVTFDGDAILWIEGRPHEGGRNVLVRWSPDGSIHDITPASANVRTRVHEYGGLAYLANRGTVYYVEFSDQRVYALAPDGQNTAITPEGNRCYADFTLDAARNRLVCVQEDRSLTNREATNELIALPLDGRQHAGEVLHSGYDFYAHPRLNREGTRLAWICWRHPQMPWDGTELWMADVTASGPLANARRVAGNADEAIFQPGWSPDGTLYFVSDRSGWWNLYRAREDRVEAVTPIEADLGRPLWQLGMSTWAFSTPSRIAVSYQQSGRWRLGLIDLTSDAFLPVPTDLEPGETIAAMPTHAVFVAGSTSAAESIVRIELSTFTIEHLRVASSIPVDPVWFSAPQAIEFPTEHGLTAHAFFYEPENLDFSPAADERPPLIVISHGGPTASTSARLNLELQFWTSRGFAVVDVNYGGSSGYGRAYRRRLDREWGVVDVNDCVNAARFLASQGRVDGRRLIIRGRSAGGYTTLAALTFRPGVFGAGASYYGVSDLTTMAQDTHKFESRYLERLVGPYPADADRYVARSPIRFVDRLSCPVIFFQGLEDQVVLPAQSQRMAEAIRAKGLSAPLFVFPGEQHGFRRADTIARCLDAELAFYRDVFGL